MINNCHFKKDLLGSAFLFGNGMGRTCRCSRTFALLLLAIWWRYHWVNSFSPSSTFSFFFGTQRSFRRFARFRLGFGGFHTPSALSIYKCNVCIMTNVTCSAHVGICQHESSVLERTSKLLIRTSHWVQAMYSFISASFVELFQLQKRSKIISQQKSAVNACCADR